jgi:signal transduction histidine kinase
LRDTVEIEISDAGPNVPAEDLPCLEILRASSAQGAAQGTGFGFSI